MDYDFSIHDDRPAAEADIVGDGLGDWNDAAGVLQDVQALCVFVRRGGVVVGGAVGRTWGECCELQHLWVADAHRHHGLGQRLLQAFEQRARERGCRLAYLETFSFQTPAFYEARGYRVALEFRGYTHGVVKYTMTKAM